MCPADELEIDIKTEILALLLSLGHIVTALWVTVHVLLTNRNVRSSIGWIGLASLSPYIGSAIYVAFGVNRTARRAEKLRDGVTARQVAANAKAVLDAGLPNNIITLERANALATVSPIIGGNGFDLFQDGTRAYPEMIAAIAEAQTSIVLASYIFADDKSGDGFATALVDAHQRGVQVRVLVDGIGSGYFRSKMFVRLRRAGVPVARFLHEWLPWTMAFINLRNHKKILVVDGRVGFTGGMNICADNVGVDGPPQVQDVHARLTGPILTQLMQTFEQDWHFTTGERLSEPELWPEIAHQGTVEMRGISSGPDENVGTIATVWAQAIENAEMRIRIVTPYFLPEDWLLGLLNRAADRGVEVQILVPEFTNHFYFNWAMRSHLGGLRLDRVSCFMAPAPFDHGKLMSVDGHWCSFGSPNWDARSMRLNFEFLLECYDEEGTAKIDAVIDAKLANAKRLNWEMLNSRPGWQKLRDATARLFLPYL